MGDYFLSYIIQNIRTTLRKRKPIFPKISFKISVLTHVREFVDVLLAVQYYYETFNMPLA